MLEHFFKGLKTPARLRQTYFGSYLDSFAEELVSGGYAVHSGWLQINVVEAFGRWLRKNGIAVSSLTGEHAEKYLLYRKRNHLLRRSDCASFRRLMNLLRRQGVITGEDVAVSTPIDILSDEFVDYLSKQRGLAESTILCYKDFAVRFLKDQLLDAPCSLSLLCAADVIDFVRRQAVVIKSKRVKLMTTALRSFLRFALYRDYINIDLAVAVPSVAHWSMASIPKALKKEHVAEILQHCPRDTTLGRRDYAILLLLARLGLRAGEVAALSLDDIDWQERCIVVNGKGGQCSKMPIPRDVGEALAAYLQKSRPATTACRAVFLRTRAPFVGFQGGQAVGNVVKRALCRAGIISKRNGAHQLRHALACEMLRQNASITEIGELLRHRSPQSTMIYAKVDLSSLRQIALQWPGGLR